MVNALSNQNNGRYQSTAQQCYDIVPFPSGLSGMISRHHSPDFHTPMRGWRGRLHPRLDIYKEDGLYQEQLEELHPQTPTEDEICNNAHTQKE